MKKLIAPFLLLCCSAAAVGQTVYRPVIESVVNQNSHLGAEALKIDAARAAASADNTVAGPEAEFEHLWSSSTSDIKWNLGLTQEFDFPGLYGARSLAADARAEASRMVLLSIKADKALEAKLLILDIINARQRLQLYSEMGANIRRILELTQHSYNLGEATILDLRKMQLANADNERALSEITTDIINLQASLCGLGATMPETYVDSWTSYPPQACEAPTAETEMLLNAIYKTEAEAAKAESKAVRLSGMPSFSLGYRHAYEEQQHFNGFSIALRLPSYSQKKRREAARLEAEAASFEVNSQLISAMAQNKGYYDSALEIANTMRRYEALSGDNSYLELLSKAYDGGELTVIDYLNEINLFANARLSFLDLQYRYNTTLARLNRYHSMDF